MESFPHGAMIVISALPLLGLGTLAVVLFALGANRDRLILPGVVVVFLAVSSWGAAVEFGPSVKTMLAKPEAKVAPIEDVALNDAQPPDEPAPDPVVTKRPAKPRDDGPHLVPLIEDEAPADTADTEKKPFKRREYRVNSRRDETAKRPTMPAPETKPEPQPETKPEPPARPKPEPRVTPKPEAPTPPPRELQPVPREDPPKPPPRELAKNDWNSPPADLTPPSSGSGPGTLVIKFTGTLVENSSEPARSPHLLVIIDGKEVQAVGPSSIREQHQDNDDSKPLQGVLYTWDAPSLTFSGLAPGFHFVMIDTSLEDQGAHQSSMLGGGKDDNDYNGTIEIKAGETAVMEFGSKNFMSGKIKRTR